MIELSPDDKQNKPNEIETQTPAKISLEAGCIAGCTKIEHTTDGKVIFHCSGCEVPFKKEQAGY